MQKIYQLVAGFRFGDAISNSALKMRDVFQSWGCQSEILAFSSAIAPEMRKTARDVEVASKELTKDDVAVLHLSIGNPINKIFRNLPCRKVIVYHNMTPSKYFRLLDPALAADLDEGRKQICDLAGIADINLAVSAYNASELTEAGYKDVKVLPLPVDLDSFSSTDVDPHTMRELGGGVYNILFVGRCAPNKKIENLVDALYYLTKIEPNVRFIHVGTQAGAEAYYSLVRARANIYALQNFLPLNGVSQRTLNACYASAHAFLCLSEHEGFCAPLIEAMLHQVPVFALEAAAVPETLGGAGVLFSAPPDYPVIAETIAEVLHNKKLRDEIVAKQNKRLDAFRNRDLAGEMRTLFEPVLRA